MKILYKEGEDTEPFGINRECQVETIPGSFESYDLGSTGEPLVLPMTFWSERPLTREKRIEISQWLFQDDFCEFYAAHEPDIIYYCKLQGDTTRFIANGETGYIETELICDSPFAWSRPMIQRFTLSDNPNFLQETTLEVRNDSNYKNWYEMFVKIKVPAKNATSISDIKDIRYTIRNLTTHPEGTQGGDSGTFELSGVLNPNQPLQWGERLQIDMPRGNIYTDYCVGADTAKPYPHRRKNCNGQFIRLVSGINKLKFTGYGEYEIVTQYPVLH